MTTGSDSSWIKLVCLLGLGFLTVGAASCLVVYSSTKWSMEATARRELESASHLAALQIDADAHSTIRDEGDLHSAAHREGVLALERTLANLPNIQSLYTLRLVEGELINVLRPDADRNPSLSKATNLDATSVADALEAIQSGYAVLSDSPATDGSGSYLTAYVPLTQSDGSLDSVLVVRQDYSSVLLQMQELRAGLWLGLAIAVLISALLASTISYGLVRSGRSPWGELALHRKRRVWMSIGILALAAAIVSDGAIEYLEMRDSTAEQGSTIAVLRSLNTLQALMGAPPEFRWKSQMAHVSRVCRSKQRLGLATLIDEFSAARLADGADQSTKRANLALAMKIEMGELQSSLADANGKRALASGEQATRLILTALMSVFALALLGTLSGQQSRFKQAVSAGAEFQTRYDNLIQTLPIGLFGYAAGECIFTNGAWGTAESESTENVLSAIHPDDRVAFDRALELAEKDGKPFSATLRIQCQDLTNIHFEAYCAPVAHEAGGSCHLLVFCVDVTPLVRAKNEVHRKHRQVENKNYLLSTALAELEGNLEVAVRTMVRAIDAKDPYTAGHSERVRNYSSQIARHLGLSATEIATVEHGALVHDVGKIGIPDEILLKPEKLTGEEYEIVKQHTIKGAAIVSEMELFRDCLQIVKYHHERLDGSGYPDGLSGDDIQFIVRIVSVADMFDAMTTSRAYRAGKSVEESMEIIWQDVKDGKLDVTVVKALESTISELGLTGQIDQADGLAA
ncbi:MAG: HD domain-containing protein [Armatimonadetes bacterium]|nr:HD domain-containing protein [Armatimonadota bacterium]